MKILITVPSMEKPGGVSNFYHSLKPFLMNDPDFEIEYFEVGNTGHQNLYLYALNDQFIFHKKISQKIDLVHINPSLNFKSLVRDGIFILQARIYKIPVVVFWHGWDKKVEKKIERWFKWLFSRTFGHANQFVVLASAFEQKLIAWGIKAPICKLATTIATEMTENFSINDKLNKLKKNTKKTNLLFLSRLEKNKGIFETIDAVKILIGKGYDLTLTIAGSGTIENKIKNYIKNCNLNGNIKTLGYVTGKFKIAVFNNNEIYCFPSSSEGLPISVLEAMAFGMAVVTRPVGGIKDFFIEGKMGYLSQSNHPKEIAACIERLINNKKGLEGIANFNYAYTREHFMPDQIYHRLKKLYNSLVKKRF